MQYKREKRIFGIITAIYWFSLYTYVPILSPYAQSLGASGTLIGLIIGSYGFTQMMIRIPMGIVSDKIKRRKPFVVGGIIIAVISGIGPYVFRNPLVLLLFRGLSGVAAASWVIFTVLFASYFEEKDMPKALGYINAYNSFGQVSAMFLGGIVAQSQGQEYTFLLAAVVGCAGILLSFKIKESKNIDTQPLVIKDILLIGKNKNLMVSSLLAIIFQVLTFTTVFGFTPIIAKDLGASNFELGLLSTLSTVPIIFASFLSGTFFKEKIGIRQTIILGFVVSALSCMAVPLSSSLMMLYITQIIGGFGRGVAFSLLMTFAIQDIESNKRATAMGFFQAIYGIGMFLGPGLVGVVSDLLGMEFAFMIIAALGFLGAVIGKMYLGKRDHSTTGL